MAFTFDLLVPPAHILAPMAHTMRTGAEHYVYRYNVLCVPVAAVLTLQLSGCGVSFSDVPLSMHPLRFLCAALAAWATPSGRLQAASRRYGGRCEFAPSP